MSIPTFGDGRPAPSPEEIDWQHQRAGRGRDRVHHFLGLDADDASPGNHTHDGKNSLRIDVANLEGALADLPGLADYLAARPMARNLIPNARGRVNQMGSTSGTSLALNAYFLDLWRSLTATNAVTWTGSDDLGRVLTVPASKEVRAPVVEQRDVLPDDYVLVNYGTAQARVYNAGGSAPALAAATTSAPLAVTLDGTANVYVEFGPGTIDRPMLVRASEWSGYFPDISYADDLAWCQRFYVTGFAYGGATADNDYAYNVMGPISYPVPMRSSPTITILGGGLEGHHSTPPAASGTGVLNFSVKWSGGAYRDIGAQASVQFAADARL